MRRALADERARSLVLQSTRQREAIANLLSPWPARARQLDDALIRLHRHPGRIGFAAGIAFGALVALRPRFLVSAVRALVLTAPVLRLLRRR